VKDLKLALTESEQRHVMKLEQLTRENQSLRNQVELLEPQIVVKPDFNATANQVKVEQLTEKIRDLEHQSRIQTDEAAMMQKKLQALLKDKECQLEFFRDANPEQVKQLKTDFETKMNEYNSYIVELETKLEWYIENQDIANDIQNRIERYENAVLELNAIETGKFNKNRSGSDIKRIKVLENQLKDLQEDSKLIAKSIPTLNGIISARRPLIPPEDNLKLLKQRIHHLEGENTEIRNVLNRKIRDLDLEV
jgi:hypothetical protein